MTMIMNRLQRPWPKKRPENKRALGSKEEDCSDDDTKSDHSPMSDHADSPDLNSHNLATEATQRKLFSGNDCDEKLLRLLMEASGSDVDEGSPFMFDYYSGVTDDDVDRDDVCLLSKHDEEEEDTSFHRDKSSERVGLLSELESPFERMSYDVDTIEEPTGEELDLAELEFLILPVLAMETSPSAAAISSNNSRCLKSKNIQEEPRTQESSSSSSSLQTVATTTACEASPDILVPLTSTSHRPARSKKLYERLKKQRVLLYRKRHRYDSGRACDLSTVTEMPSEEERSSAASPHTRKHSTLPSSVEFDNSPTTVVIDVDGVIEEVSLDEMQEI